MRSVCPSSRLPSFHVDCVQDACDAELYRSVEAKMYEIYPNPKDVHSAMAYLSWFVRYYNKLTNEKIPHAADHHSLWSITGVVSQPLATRYPTVALNGSREGAETAASTWQHMLREFKWSERYTRRVRTTLAHTLQDIVPALAVIVNPSLRVTHSLRLEATRSSQSQQFSLVECLPLSVRKLHPNNVLFRLTEKIGSEFVDCLQSISKAYLQKILQMVEALIMRDPPLLDGAAMHTLDEAWAVLAQLSAQDWLMRYQTVYTCNEPALAHATFRNHMHMLNRLHCKILQPRALCTIPVPTLGGGCTPQLRGHRTPFSGSSFSTSGSSGDDEKNRTMRRDIRSLMLNIRNALCRGGTLQVDAEEVVYSFSPNEIRTILNGAMTTCERLIVWLLLTTGLLIGGLSRLRAGPGPFASTNDVSRTLSTTEKNNKERRIVVGPVGRLLIAHWYREDRRVEAGLPSVYLFPSPTKKDRAISTHWLWNVCRRVFVRSGLLTGSKTTTHLHPHTFRHTFIHYMYMSGSSFEEIAKFIGHANPNITSGVYGRLRQVDAESCASCLPWVGDDRQSTKDEWMAIGRLLCNPWSFSETELGGGSNTTSDVNGTGKAARRQVHLEESKAARRRIDTACLPPH